MEGLRERFAIEIRDKGLVINGEGETKLHFTAVEALMLLDILRNEEATLRRLADEAAPIKIHF
jgi:hypothetical protein